MPEYLITRKVTIVAEAVTVIATDAEAAIAIGREAKETDRKTKIVYELTPETAVLTNPNGDKEYDTPGGYRPTLMIGLIQEVPKG